MKPAGRDVPLAPRVHVTVTVDGTVPARFRLRCLRNRTSTWCSTSVDTDRRLFGANAPNRKPEAAR
jgi:hypothetical protein